MQSLDTASHATMDSFAEEFETNFEITSASSYRSEDSHFSSSSKKHLSHDPIIDPCSFTQPTKVERKHFGFRKKNNTIDFSPEEFPSLAESKIKNTQKTSSPKCAQTKTQIREVTRIKSEDCDIKADINGKFDIKIKGLPLECKTGDLKEFLESFGTIEDVVLFPEDGGIVALMR